MSSKFHVLVKWPGNQQDWLVLIEAASRDEARLLIEKSPDVQRGQGTIASIEEVTE